MAGTKTTLSVVKVHSPTEEERFTLEDAFSPHLERAADEALGSTGETLATGHADLERDLRAVSMLLYHATDDGNEPLDGYAAIGLGRILDDCARRLAKLTKCARRASQFEPAKSAAGD